MAIDRISPEDWKKVLPALESCSVTTLKIVHAILVEGRKKSEVAKENGKTPQAINSAIKRVSEMLKEHDLQKLVPVNVWLPPEEAEMVRKMAQKYLK